VREARGGRRVPVRRSLRAQIGAAILPRGEAIEEAGNVRWWLRSLAVGAAAGLAAGLVAGGTLGRVFMRLLFLAREDTLGLETAMGAVIGDFTAGGTVVIFVFGAMTGLVLGLVYVCVRTLLPSQVRWRACVFVVGATGLMLGAIIRANRDDFAVLPVTLSLLLIVGSVAVAAIPVPILVERYAPDRDRSPGPAAHAIVGLGLVAIAVYATTAIATAYAAS